MDKDELCVFPLSCVLCVGALFAQVGHALGPYQRNSPPFGRERPGAVDPAVVSR